MKDYQVRVQYPYTMWYEQTVEVRAESPEAAQAEAVRQADEVIGWDDACNVGEGDYGESVPWAIAEIVDGRPGPETYCKTEAGPASDAADELLSALRRVLESIEWHTRTLIEGKEPDTLRGAAADLLALLRTLHANAGESPEWIRSRIDAVLGPAGSA